MKHTLIIAVIIILFAGAIAGMMYWFNLIDQQDAAQVAVNNAISQEEPDYEPINHFEVSKHLDMVKESPELSDNQKAREINSWAFSVAVESGYTEEGIREAIDKLKSVVADDLLVSPQVRADALTRLAVAYNSMSHDPRVLDILYEEEPYTQHFVEGKPAESSKNLYQWAHEVYPRARSAIMIARWFATEAIHPQTPANQVSELLDNAQTWLAEAEQLSEQELELSGRQNTHTSAHAAYLYWRAVTVAILTMQDRWDETREDYHDVYRDFFANANRTDLNGGATYYHEMGGISYGYFINKIDENAPQAEYYTNLAVELFTDRYESDMTRPFPRLFLFPPKAGQEETMELIMMDAMSRSVTLQELVQNIVAQHNNTLTN